MATQPKADWPGILKTLAEELWPPEANPCLDSISSTTRYTCGLVIWGTFSTKSVAGSIGTPRLLQVVALWRNAIAAA